MVLITYDQESKSIYVQLLDKDKRRVAKTIPLGGDRFLDVDENGKAIGFEMILGGTVSKEAIDAILNTGNEIAILQ